MTEEQEKNIDPMDEVKSPPGKMLLFAFGIFGTFFIYMVFWSYLFQS